MAVFASVIFLVTAVKCTPPAPFFKTHGIAELREDILSLGSDEIQYAVRHNAPLQGILPNPVLPKQQIEIIAPQIQSRALHLENPEPGSTAPQQFSHVIVENKKAPAPIKVKELRAHRTHETITAIQGIGDKSGGADKHYKHHGKEKAVKHENNHHHEVANKGEEGKEHKKKHYEEGSGNKKSYEDGDEYGEQDHKQGRNGHKAYFKKGSQGEKAHFSKGYHGVHGKDEKKHLDGFYNNNHEEGKYVHYGKANHKHGKEHFNKKGNKWEKSAEEKGSYEKDKKNGKEKAAQDASKFEKKGGDEKAYQNDKKYATSKDSKGGKSYTVKH